MRNLNFLELLILGGLVGVMLMFVALFRAKSFEKEFLADRFLFYAFHFVDWFVCTLCLGVLGVLFLGLSFPQSFIVGGMATGPVMPFIFKKNMKLLEEQEKECKSLSSLLSASQTIIEKELPEFLDIAEAHLIKAEYEFLEKAFVSFWYEVKSATDSLEEYHKRVAQVARNAEDYAIRQSRLRVSIPEFLVTHGSFPDPKPVAIKLSTVARNGQTDFEFASIYEQMKTNQILHAGFWTLNTRIEQMEYKITSALENLSDSLMEKLGDMEDSLDTLGNELACESEETRRQVQMTDKRLSATLDDIQRKQNLKH